MSTTVDTITIAHTPDADDAFMFYALTTGILKPNDFAIEHQLTSIQNLNEAALIGKYEMSAISFAGYPSVKDKYYLMSCGACMGYKSGPLLVAKKSFSIEQIKNITIAIPGKMTTANLLLHIFCPSVQVISLPFDSIMPAITENRVQAGLIIDGGQMTYAQYGLEKIFDLGQWWYEQTQLPTPLGGNIIRKDLPHAIIAELTSLFRQSIKYALDHRQEAVKYAMRYAQGMDDEQAAHFIGRYVNELTLDYGENGKQAVSELFKRGYAAGVLPELIQPEFV